jgi:hypothetical protein
MEGAITEINIHISSNSFTNCTEEQQKYARYYKATLLIRLQCQAIDISATSDVRVPSIMIPGNYNI